MDRFLSIEAFVRVAQAQSFAEAARQLRLSKSVLTTRVQQLEALVGVPLFHRTTRSVRLSEAGKAFYPDCLELVRRTNNVVDQMRGSQASPTGLLRVHALTGFVLGHLAPVVREFQRRYPELRIDLFVSDAVIDPVKQGFDVALQIFPAAAEDLVSRRLFPVRRVFCAAPSYLKKAGEPKDPGQLREHVLGLYSGYPTRDRWAFHPLGAKRGGMLSIDLKSTLLSNSVHFLQEWALGSGGIVCLPTLVASQALQSGALKVVLRDWQLSCFWLSAVYARTQGEALKLRLFIEALALAYAVSVPPWDQPLIKGRLLPEALLEGSRGSVAELPPERHTLF
jgi:DNA-binding transcriptional LysR family regulator